MSEVKIELIESQTEAILEKVGKESFINWDSFSQISVDVARSIDELNNALGIFREVQHKTFIQTMRKLKSFDVPDLLKAVKNKKLPKQALRGVLTRFKLEGDKLELIESKESLQQTAVKQYEAYIQKNKQFIATLNGYSEFINKKTAQSGLSPSQQIAVEQKQTKSTVKFNLNQELAIKIASDIKLQHLAGTQFISIDTYKQIIDGTYKLIKDEYEKLTFQGRKKQRSNISNPKQYLADLNQYLMNGEALINEGQALLAKKVGVSEKNLGQSQMALMDRGLSNDLLIIQSQLRGKIKQSVTPQKDVSIDVAKQIIRFQVQAIDKRSSDINLILSGLERGPEAIQMVPMLLALILNDYVFQKYGYEEQDFMKNLGEDVIYSNPDFIKIFRQMQMGIMTLMQKLDIVPPEVANMMKQQQAYMQQMGGAPMMPGMMPGMGQSNNPMELLQMQQMEQMQAMFSQMGLQPPK